MATATLQPRQTGGAALRSKLFGGSNLSVPTSAPTTDALKQTTDRIIKEQAQTQQAVELYKQKLQEAQTHVRRLESAYLEQATVNSQLQSKVKDDHKQLSTLIERIVSIQSTHAELTMTVHSLQSELQRVELERTELQGTFTRKFELCEDLSGKLNQLVEHSDGLQGKLEEAHQARCTLSEEIMVMKEALQAKQADISRIEAEMGAVRKAGEQRTSQLSEQLAAATRQCSEYEAELSLTKAQLAETAIAHESAIAQLAGDLSSSMAAMQKLQEQLDQADVEATAMREELAILREAKGGLEDVLQGKVESLAALTEELTAIRADMEETKAKLGEQGAVVQAQEEELATLKKSKEELEAAALERATVLERLEADRAALLEQHAIDAEGLQSQIADLESKLAAAEMEISVLQKHAQEAAQQLLKTQEAADQQHDMHIQRTIKQVEDMKANHRSELAAAAKEKEALQAQIAEMLQNHETEKLQLEIIETAAVLQEKSKATALALELEGKVRAMDALAKDHADALQKLADEHAAAAEKADKEKGTLELRLDEVNNSWRNCQAKLSEAEVEIAKRDALLESKEHELGKKDAALLIAQKDLESVDLELKKKSSLLAGIGVAANAAVNLAAQEANPATQPKQRSSSPMAARHHSKKQKVQVQDVESDSDQSDSEGEQEQEKVTNPEQAMVVHKATARQPEKAGIARAQERPRAQQPIIQEPASDGNNSDQEADSESEDERQARGRKRSGKLIVMKQQANKKTKKAPAAKPAISAGRRMGGMFSMMTASQEHGSQPDRAKAKATATSGRRKVKVDKSKSKAPVLNAEQLQSGLLNLFGGLGGSQYDVGFS